MNIAPNLARNADIAILEDSLERYLREHYSFERRRALLRNAAGIDRKHWEFLASTGLLGLPFAERDGGFGGALVDVMSVMRHLGRALVVEPYLACVVVAGRLLAQSTSAAARRAWLEPLIAGEKLAGLAHLERGDRARGAVARTTMRRTADGWQLDGAKILVPVATSLDVMLVTARDEQGRLGVLLVPAATPGIIVRTYRTADAHVVGEVAFNGVRLDAGARLDFTDLDATLDDVVTYAEAAMCAETVGCMQPLLDLTADYLRSRRQFGQPIGNFQVLKHRLVDCYAAVEQSACLLELAAIADDPRWKTNVAAARAAIGKHARYVGHDSIQMHGGMGLTDELAVSHYHKRIVVLNHTFGDGADQNDRFLALRDLAGGSPDDTTLPLERLLTVEEVAFRTEVQSFLAARVSPGIRTAVRLQTGTFPEVDTFQDWRERLNERGWLAQHWPRENGGPGWSAMQRFTYEREAALAGAPEMVPMGLRYVGPVIAHFGSPWQKEYFLPRILSGEHYWAQGFSEAGAGSDLAALSTSAVLDGDDYVVNGSKMWTTNAHVANWMFCLVRTEKASRPQHGISFLLIELDSPGVKVEPIPTMAVDHEVNTVFLTNVRVPKAHLVGEPGRAWEYVKFLLELERGGSFFCGRMRHEFQRVRELVSTVAPQLARDRVFMHRLAGLDQRLLALEMLELQGARSIGEGAAAGVRGSLTKLLGTELQQDITEAAVHVAGYGGLELVPDRPLDAAGRASAVIDLEAVAMPRYLNLRAGSIYGGSSEVQHEIIAKQILGMR